ncbi:MAG TPA: low temperature requirement protein A [Longimicrobiales bacterium]|nr:low temperature requirement protein A [Longimicrobiales bacterium]
MPDHSIASPDDQRATFVELFFDLVFVFAVTGVTHYAALHLDALGILRAVAIFWLIWWGWTQFTWALNAANTEHAGVRATTLVATAIAAAMAVSVEGAFSAERGPSVAFAVSYLAVRLIGLGLFLRVVFHDERERSAVSLFAVASVLGLLAVLVGAFLDPSVRLVYWLAAMLLDLGAGWFAGNRRPAAIRPEHFTERHGLIIIVALGESMIVAANGLSVEASPQAAVAGLAVIITCLLWWTYFGWVKGLLEESLVERDRFEGALLARDAHTFGHSPLVGGIIALAVGFEACLHPGDYTTAQAGAAVSVGLALFLGSTAAVLWRAHGCLLWNRLIVCALTLVGLWGAANFSVQAVLIVAVTGLTGIVVFEQVKTRPEVGGASFV